MRITKEQLTLLISALIILAALALITITVRTKKKSKAKNQKEIIFADEPIWQDYLTFVQAKKFCEEENYEMAMHFFSKIAQESFLEYKSEYKGDFYKLRGICYQSLNKDIFAIKDLENAILHSPTDCNNYFLIAMSFSTLNHHEEALYNLEKAIELLKSDNPFSIKHKEHAREVQNTDLVFLYEVALNREKHILKI